MQMSFEQFGVTRIRYSKRTQIWSFSMLFRTKGCGREARDIRHFGKIYLDQRCGTKFLTKITLVLSIYGKCLCCFRLTTVKLATIAVSSASNWTVSNSAIIHPTVTRLSLAIKNGCLVGILLGLFGFDS